MREQIETMISYVFGKYGMRRGMTNQLRMKALLDFCMSDLEAHPCLEKSLQTKESLEFFVIQSMIYMLPVVAENNKADGN